jgi:tetratricopeptide (TPR) repeat protein
LSHAESGYLQVLIETGLTGLILVLAALGLCAYWLFTTWKKSEREDRTRLMIISAGLAASALHSLVDFVWYIPACLIFALILAACLCRVHQLTTTTAGPQIDNATHSVWPTCWAMIVVLFIFPVGRVSADVTLRDANSEASWMSYREQSVAAGNQGGYESLDAVDERLDLMVTYLEECLRIDPTDFRAMSDLSTLYLRRFERNQQTTGNPMSVQEIRNTVETTEFESPKDILKWLRRAFGENSSDLYRSYTMAGRAVHGQPLRGECYLILAQLGFLRDASAQDKASLIEQAVLTRPYSAPVLYFAGMSEAENGDIEKACEWWKKSFHLSDEVQPLIVRTLASHMTPQEIVDRIDPGPKGLWLLYKQYAGDSASSDRDWVANWYGQKFQTLSQQITSGDKHFWLRSSDIFKASGKTEKAIFCLGQAVRQAPEDYALRKRFGLELLAGQAKNAAVKELEWCLLRNPDDREITNALASIRQSSLQGIGS